MLTSDATYWNGLPTNAERGTATVADAPDFPLYWARDIVGQRIAVVRLTPNLPRVTGGEMYLDDRDGSGWHKVTIRRGSPRSSHRNVSVEPESFTSHDPRCIRLTGSEFNTYCDCQTLRMIDQHQSA